MNKIGRRKTQEEWDKEVYSLVEDEYKFLDKYKNASTKLRVIHRNCGTLYKVDPNSFQQGRRCPICAEEKRRKRSKRTTNEEWKEIVKNLVGDEYTFIEKYEDYKTPIKVRHNKCGRVYKVVPQEFKRGSRCWKCGHKRTSEEQKITQEEFYNSVKEACGNDYTFLERYVNKYTPIKVRHNKCGTVYKVAPNDFSQGRRCKKCHFRSRLKTQKEWNNQVEELGRGNYEFLESYKGDSIKIKVKHKECGREFYTKPNSFILGRRCPYCILSKGETLVENYLLDNSLLYERQKKFSDLKDYFYLSYDFYIPKKEVLIEYQGRQHYYPISFFGGQESLSKQKIHDNMKRNYAKVNEFTLIEIPYTVTTAEEIKTILDNKL